jgi:hypothetical protein
MRVTASQNAACVVGAALIAFNTISFKSCAGFIFYGVPNWRLRSDLISTATLARWVKFYEMIS